MKGLQCFLVALILSAVSGVVSVPWVVERCTTNDIDCRTPVQEVVIRCTTHDIDC
ncbi:hypothetical protein B0H14DRAFT_3887683 [Mycena olivaceomarginata]|nr:hypothetical protein B0H14DRAFT_3887683 [Mycena olivaceomarginata]